MTVRDSAWPAGTPCWVDLAVDDVDRARTFYSGLLRWDVPPGPAEAGGYAIALLDGRAVAGIGPKQNPTQPTAWTTYLATDDADDTAARVRDAGGQVPLAPFDVLDAGRLALATDPAGALFGLWQARAHIGAAVANEPGALVWTEQLSRDFDGSKAFYATVFGYEYGDISAGDFHYATIKVAGNDVAGIGALPGDAPSDVPAGWKVYFAVANTDDAVATATRLGGRVLSEPQDTPYGRMATVTDDQGATFAVITLPA